MSSQLPPGATPRARSGRMPTQLNPNAPVESQLPQGAVSRPFQAPPAPAQVPSTDPTFLDRSSKLLEPRFARQQRLNEAYMSDVIDSPEFYASRMANSMGAFFDIAGEGVMTVLSAITPDRWERLLKENLAAGGTKLMSTETAKELLELWNGFDQMTKDRFASVADATAGAGQFVKSPTSIAGEKLSASAIKSDKKGLSTKVLDQTTEARQARGKEIGREKDKQFQTNFDEDILNTVVSLPGVTGNTKLPQLIKKLNTASAHLNSKITQSLKKSQVTIPAQTIKDTMQRRMQQLIVDNPEFADIPELRKIIKQVGGITQSALKGYDGKPLSLLQVRRNLDRIVSKTFGDNLYDGVGASRQVVKQVRDSLNDLMKQAVPDDDNLHALMQRQHHLLEALDNASYANTKVLPKGPLQRAGSIVERHPFLAAGALGVTEQGSSMLSIPPGLATAGAAALGVYGATTPNVRRVVGGTLERAPVTTGLLYGTSNMGATEPTP